MNISREPVKEEEETNNLDRETYNRIQARKIGYEHLMGMSLENAKVLLASQGKEITHTEWNSKEEYLEDGEYVENQVNLVLKNGIVWSVSLSYDNSII